MLISHQARFLFVHIQKTAGSSLRQVLQESIPDLESFLGTHDPALQARRHLGATVYRRYFTAAFVRNPWDRLVSWYSMIAQAPRDGPSWIQASGQPMPRLWQYVHENSNSFEEFIRNCTSEIDDFDGRKSFCRNQMDYLVDQNGRRIVDFVGQYENLHSDAQRLFDALGLNGTELPCVNTSRHEHYSVYYSNELAEIVRHRYHRDIEAFGYEFVRVGSSLHSR